MHEEEEEEGRESLCKKKKRRRRFWSKLMGKRREDGELMHSKTMKDKASAKWVVFS